MSYKAQVRTGFRDRSMVMSNAKSLHQKVSDAELLGLLEIDDTDSMDDEAQVSVTNKLRYMISSSANYVQMSVTKNTDLDDDDDDTSQDVDTKCAAVSTCIAKSGDHRKVVSHIFGRNKACTRELPKKLWILWCRKHYQRFRYRGHEESWNVVQLELIRKQLQIFEDWGQIRSWTVTLRRTERLALAKESENGFTCTNNISACWEHFLVPYLGPNKTFAQIREILGAIERKYTEAGYHNRVNKLKTFPGVEFLPNFGRHVDKKGKKTYKKITLHTQIFKRKNKANIMYMKQMAAKKAEASNTLKSFHVVSDEGESPDTINGSAGTASVDRETPTTDRGTTGFVAINHNMAKTTAAPPSSSPGGTKRKVTPPTDKASLSHPSKRPRTKRPRRLIRGYERHGPEWWL